LKKVKPPTFDRGNNKDGEEKYWLLGMKKYVKVLDYFESMKAKVAIFSLNGKDDRWWEELRNVKYIRENELSWNTIENCL